MCSRISCISRRLSESGKESLVTVGLRYVMKKAHALTFKLASLHERSAGKSCMDWDGLDECITYNNNCIIMCVSNSPFSFIIVREVSILIYCCMNAIENK